MLTRHRYVGAAIALSSGVSLYTLSALPHGAVANRWLADTSMPSDSVSTASPLARAEAGAPEAPRQLFPTRPVFASDAFREASAGPSAAGFEGIQQPAGLARGGALDAFGAVPVFGAAPAPARPDATALVAAPRAYEPAAARAPVGAYAPARPDGLAMVVPERVDSRAASLGDVQPFGWAASGGTLEAFSWQRAPKTRPAPSGYEISPSSPTLAARP